MIIHQIQIQRITATDLFAGQCHIDTNFIQSGQKMGGSNIREKANCGFGHGKT